MERREFIKICAATAAMAASKTFAAQNTEPRFYSRTLLVDLDGQPFKASRLQAKQNYIFNYPFIGTPCFLLKLDKPTAHDKALFTADGKNYHWKGGVGADHSIVAYSAICAHRLAYPTKQISFISYRGDSGSNIGSANVIHCCAEHSEYDPAQGAKVVSGPANQPLAAILLEYDKSSEELFAVGTLGGELFNDFFSKYDFRLNLEYGEHVAQKPVSGESVVSELTSFCQQQVKC
ncbi:MAG TPA: (2Fe-2S)-binding protein [Burkholderiales bacterium]|nr:(2Fe-2S)-binding protein [Burkholderiales bacterium]